MISQSIAANRLAIRLGVWSAFCAALALLIFTGCFIALVGLQPLLLWTNLNDYVTYRHTYPSPVPDLARLMALCFGIAYLVLLNALYEYANPNQKILARISLSLGLLFVVLTGTHYFVQISTVRLSLLDGQLAGLEQVVQANPYSAFAAMNMLGWTIGLGMSSLFLAPLFAGSALDKTIRIALIANGVCCLAGGVGYVLKWVVVVFLTINLGMGGALTVGMIGLWLFFRRINDQYVTGKCLTP